MTKLRVHEYAKQNNVSSKDVISKLKELNIEVTNHMTALDDTTIQKLNDSMQPKQEQEAPKQEETPKQVQRLNYMKLKLMQKVQ